MRFCAVCGRGHDEVSGCFGNGVGRPPGQETHGDQPHTSADQSLNIAREADKFIAKLLLFTLAVLAIMMALVALLRR